MLSFTHYSINVSPLEMGTKARFSETRQQDNMREEKHGGSGPKVSVCARAPTLCSFMNWPQIYHTNKELFSELKIWLCIYDTRSATNTFCLPLKFTHCVSFIYSLKNILTIFHVSGIVSEVIGSVVKKKKKWKSWSIPSQFFLSSWGGGQLRAMWKCGKW